MRRVELRAILQLGSFVNQALSYLILLEESLVSPPYFKEVTPAFGLAEQRDKPKVIVEVRKLI
jgi:hypothetical protein